MDNRDNLIILMNDDDQVISAEKYENLKRDIKSFMRGHCDNYDNATALAEDAANMHNVSNWLDDPNNDIWDWAIDATDWD